MMDEIHIGGIAFPGDLIKALREDNLVIFAGAGVSMGEPARLPNFLELADRIAQGTGQSYDKKKDTIDRFLGKLSSRGINVHQKAAYLLDSKDKKSTPLHKYLISLFGNPTKIRIVTTNFDTLFESALNDELGINQVRVFEGPSLPLGNSFSGIVHIHGSILHPGEMVLTDQDFGQAYITRGWASRFLVDLFLSRVTLFIGYSHDDIVLQYLARALPVESSSKRFVLFGEKEGDLSKWNLLGIQPILFHQKKPSDFCALTEGIRLLSKSMTAGFIDSRNRLISIAKLEPPQNIEDVDFVLSSLEDDALIRVFTDNASSYLWIPWLNDHNSFDALFRPGQLDKKDSSLASWLASNFAIDHPETLFMLIGKKGHYINQEFWNSLLLQVVQDDIGKDKAKIVSKWATIFLTFSTDYKNCTLLSLLAEQCGKMEHYDDVLRIFEVMSEPSFKFEVLHSILRPGINDNNEDGVTINILYDGDAYYLNKIWREILAPHLELIAKTALKISIGQIEKRHYLYAIWNNACFEWDPDSLSRHTIEEKSHDHVHHGFSVLIDMARDCGEWLFDNYPNYIASQIDDWEGGDIPLLRRLAVHLVQHTSSLSEKEKIHWALSHCDFYDSAIHHELYGLFAQFYPKIGYSDRQSIISKALSTYPRDKQNKMSSHYCLLKWLQRSAPECPQLSKAIIDLENKNPNLKNIIEPQLDYSVLNESGWVKLISPWTAEELLEKSPSCWIEDISSFHAEGFDGPSREGLAEELTKVSSINLQWAIDFAKLLIDLGNQNDDLVRSILLSWAKVAILDESSLCKVIDFLDDKSTDFYARFLREIASLLLEIVSNNPKPFVIQYLEKTNKLAIQLWPLIVSRSDLPNYSEMFDNDLYSAAINDPAGILAQYWIADLDFIRKAKAEKYMPALHVSQMALLAQERSISGILARSVFFVHFSFLLSVDELWTNKYLLPKLETLADANSLFAAWNPFIKYGRLTAHSCEVLKKPIKTLLDNNTVLCKIDMHQFVDKYLTIGIYLYDLSQLINYWFEALLTSSIPNIKGIFAQYIYMAIAEMPHERRIEWWKNWLRQLLINRVGNIPSKLEDKEAFYYLLTVVYLDEFFDDAVDIITSMPFLNWPQDEGLNSPIYQLKDKDFFIDHPSAMIKFLKYLDSCRNIPRWFWFGLNEILAKLNKDKLDSSMRDIYERLLSKYC